MTPTKLLSAAVTALVLLSGCNRESASNDPASRFDTIQSESGGAAQIEVGGNNTESADWGHFALKINKVYQKQKPLDQAPWRRDGGDWTFLECELGKSPGAIILIGTQVKISEKNYIGTGFGEARLVVSDPSTAAQFIDAFATAFHSKSPPSHGNKPPRFIKMQTAVLGSDLVRDSAGGFKSGHRGGWTATKWFLQDEVTEAEAEVFFNFSLSEKRAEFSEKDEEYRDTLVQQFVIGLRDGPLPERTLENDPSLTLSGPRITNWTRIANPLEFCQFHPDNRTIIISAHDTNVSHAKLSTATIEHPTERKPLAEFEGSIYIQQFLSFEAGPTLLVVETLHPEPKRISSSDPQRLWLVDPQGKHEITTPSATNCFLAKTPISPNGQFIALLSWEGIPGKKRTRVIQLGDLNTRQWRRIAVPDTALELIGWNRNNLAGIVLALSGFGKNDTSTPYSLDATTGQLTPLPSLPPEFQLHRELSPDGKRFAEVQGKENLIITDIATGQKHQFTFHPYDQPSVYPDSIHWANHRYLIFQGQQTALINADTLKMNFVLPKDSDIQFAEFSPNFKYALGSKKDGNHYLGIVETND